jgi:hypothetical protein
MSQGSSEQRFDSLRRALAAREVPQAYAQRLMAELESHHHDHRAALESQGVSATEADTRSLAALGAEQETVDAALRSLRRGNFIGRHRILCFIAVPLLVYPILYLVLTIPVAGLIMFGVLGGRDTTHTTTAFICKWIFEGFANVAVPMGFFWLISRTGRKSFAGRGYVATAQLVVFLISIVAELRVNLPSASYDGMSITLGIPYTVYALRDIESIWICVYVATILMSMLAARRRPAIELSTI